MQRSDIKIEAKRIIKYCKRENKFQQQVYQRKVNAKTMTQYAANENFLIIRELGELAEDLLRKDLSWKDLRKMVQALPNKKQIKPIDLFTKKQ